MPSPVKVTLVTGRNYLWCACGLTRFQESQMCDGISCHFCSDKEEGFVDKVPLIFTAQGVECNLCTCKQTKTPPYCDGSHKTVKDES